MKPDLPAKNIDHTRLKSLIDVRRYSTKTCRRISSTDSNDDKYCKITKNTDEIVYVMRLCMSCSN